MVLAISVVYRGCAIPVAWVILPAGTKHAWRREWLRLLRLLRPAIPRGWTVIVLADRGLYAPVAVSAHHPAGLASVFAHQHGRQLSASRGHQLAALATFVPRPGTSWRGTGLAFTRNQVACTLLARWEEGDKDPG